MWSNFLNPSISRAAARWTRLNFSIPKKKPTRSRVAPPQLLHPNPRETNEDGTAIVKAAEHKSMNKGNNRIKGQRASNDAQLAQLIIAATAHLVYMMTEGEL